MGYWVGGVLLLIAVMLSSTEETNIAGSIIALCGSALVSGLLVYEIGKFIPFRLGFIQGSPKIVPFQSSVDFSRSILNTPVFVAFLISSLASLVLSVWITVHLRNRTNRSL
jgi:hypothetical protein